MFRKIISPQLRNMSEAVLVNQTYTLRRLN